MIKIDNELKKLAKYKGSTVVRLYPLINMVYQFFKCKSDARVTVSRYGTPGCNGAELSTLIIEPKQCAEALPCIMFYHGGGFLLRASMAHYQMAKLYAERANCKVVLTDYRLLPKYRFPIAIEDCYHTFHWVLKNAGKLNINSDKIILAGDSAGGNIAAAVALMLQDRRGIAPKGVLLIYPVLDRSMNSESMKKYKDAPIWDAGSTKLFWEIYLKNDESNQIPYASPMDAPSLKHFPKTYIEVAEYDCLHDEGVAFAKKIQSEGIPVELHEVKGACHGFEAAIKSAIVTKAINRRIKWIRTVFDEGVEHSDQSLRESEESERRVNMKKIDIENSKRAEAFHLWMSAPNPMVTLFKTLDVTPLFRYSKKKSYKFHMLLCWCIGMAADEIEEFFVLPVGDELIQYDQLAVNTIVKNKEGEVSSCDISLSKDLKSFNRSYLKLTRRVHETCKNHNLTKHMVIGTSAITNTEIDGVVGMYSGIFNNPFLFWGKYKRVGLKKYMTISFQFHHTQMDGAHAGRFLENLQNEIMGIGKDYETR